MATKRKNEAVDTLRKEAPDGVGRELIRAAGLLHIEFPEARGFGFAKNFSRYIYAILVTI